MKLTDEIQFIQNYIAFKAFIKLNKRIQQMLDSDIIHNSTSVWSIPIGIMSNEIQQLRKTEFVYGDTVDDKYLPSQIVDLLDKLVIVN